MLGILGFIAWVLGALIWMGGQSAIHEILAAIIILNGTVLISASYIGQRVEGLLQDLSGKIEQAARKGNG